MPREVARNVQAIRWPEGRRFAFTIFDDLDAQTAEQTRLIYSFLADLGFRTTIAVWPLDARHERNSPGETCANEEYLKLLLDFKRRGFEIGFHNAAPHSSTRAETIEGLEQFRKYFGANPSAMANHYNDEAIYWGAARLTGWRRSISNLLTRSKNNRFTGHIPGNKNFWGDVCRDNILYCRNFVFADINTLAACPWV